VKRLDNDELIKRLKVILRERHLLEEAYSEEEFRNALIRAEVQFIREEKQAKWDFLEELLDYQIETLLNDPKLSKFVNSLVKQRDLVLIRANAIWCKKYHGENLKKLTIKHGIHLVIPVLPTARFDSYIFLNMIRYSSSKTRHIKIDLTKICDVVDAPENPYYIYDVDDGETTRGKSPNETIEIFKRQGRSPLTVAEVIALHTHVPDILLIHDTWACGSRYDNDDNLVVLVSKGSCYFNGPVLCWNNANAPLNIGSPSCGSSV
jgi:hypothetical protein